jgi:hypothetical protein
MRGVILEAHPIENGTEWNELLMSCSDFSVFSSFQWGEYKKRSWDVWRLAFSEGGDFVGGVQILLKRRLGLTVGWSPGGIHLLDFKDLPRVVHALTAHVGKLPFALRINFLQEELNEEKEGVLRRATGLTRARRRLWVGSTVLVDLGEGGDSLEPVSGNHRRNYRKALRHDLTFDEGSVSSSEFVRLNNAMVELKNLPGIALRIEDVEQAAHELGNHMRMYSVRMADELLSSCLVMRFGGHAYYYLAASSERGRELKSSFYLIVELLKRLKADRVKQFDFGGIAPQRENARGVSRFKTGFSGRLVRYVGEYDLTNSRVLCWLLNLAIGRKFRDRG